MSGNHNEAGNGFGWMKVAGTGTSSIPLIDRPSNYRVCFDYDYFNEPEDTYGLASNVTQYHDHYSLKITWRVKEHSVIYWMIEY